MRFISAFTIAVLVGPLTAYADDVSRFYGDWHIDSIAGHAEISAGDDAAEKLLGKTATISPTGFTLADETCNRSTSVISTVEVDKFLSEEWRTERRDLDLGKYKLGARTQYIRASCGLALVLSHDEILLDQAGAMLLASRQR